MVDPGGEVHLGGLEGVVGREVDGEKEDTARVWGLALTRTSLASIPQHNRRAEADGLYVILDNKAHHALSSLQNLHRRRGDILTGPIIVACQWNCEQQSVHHPKEREKV